MSVSMSVQEQIVKREEEHIGNLEKYENQIKQKTKWYPKISLEEGLKKYYSN